MLLAYLDTCLMSAQVKNDLKPVEQAALNDIVDAYRNGKVSLVSSNAAKDELERIPEVYKQPHLAIFELFSCVPTLQVGGLTRRSVMGTPTGNPKRRLWKELSVVLPDEDDIWHVFIASCNRIKYLVTVDERTILSHKIEILNVSGVNAVLPSELMALVRFVGT